ncbi:hypothetical protein RC62_2522 [Flavobacterium aquidurense]|uniref:Uncharacterized protein n=1 Tax=Flavobacterium aquidurense TaxID=362413 RepID=A0A0N8VLS7_9FLAO|nr:hypothetical protein RC62_2522 [Flavobacterium aquidurense]
MRNFNQLIFRIKNNEKRREIHQIKIRFYPRFCEVNPFHPRSNNLNQNPKVIKN